MNKNACVVIIHSDTEVMSFFFFFVILLDFPLPLFLCSKRERDTIDRTMSLTLEIAGQAEVQKKKKSVFLMCVLSTRSHLSYNISDREV